jgi:hypothetical protein
VGTARFLLLLLPSASWRLPPAVCVLPSASCRLPTAPASFAVEYGHSKWGTATETGLDVVPPLQFIAFANLPAQQDYPAVSQ